MRKDLLELVHNMPASNVVNYIFQNNGDLTFKNVNSSWGINIHSNSNGAAYADLDNDGDLDLVVNNINQPAFIYENKADLQKKNHFLQIKLYGAGLNSEGLGAKVTLFIKDKKQYLEQSPACGFQSSVSPVLHFGLGADKNIDSLLIVWQSGKEQKLFDLKGDQVLKLEEKNATSVYKFFAPLISTFLETKSPIAYKPVSNTINDFKRQPLLINSLSFSGPCLVKGDVNGDGLEDVFAAADQGRQDRFIYNRKTENLQKRMSLLLRLIG